MRDLLEAVLSLEGYEPVLAASGEAALELLREGKSFDAVLTDVHMPGLEGADLATSLRKAMPRGSLLLGMSGSAPAEELRALFDAFVSKPFDAEALQRAVAAAQKQQAKAEQAGLGGSELTAQGDMPATEVVGASVPLDETVFQSLVKIIPKGQLGQLYDMTLSDIGKRHARIEASLREGDLPAAQREAHAIKGSCGMVGAMELQALAAVIEDGTTLNTHAVDEIPAACLRLRRMLDGKLQTV